MFQISGTVCIHVYVEICNTSIVISLKICTSLCFPSSNNSNVMTKLKDISCLSPLEYNFSHSKKGYFCL